MKLLGYLRSLAAFLLLQLTWEAASQTKMINPRITIDALPGSWQNLSSSVLGSNKPGFYHPQNGHDLWLTCDANYPIQWVFTGLVLPREVVKIVAPLRNLAEKTYTIKVLNFFLESEDFPESSYSFRLSCESISDPKYSDEIFVFVKGNNRKTLVPPKTDVVVDSPVIPCPTTVPGSKVTLYQKRQNGREEEVKDPSIKYFPVEGFRSNQNFEGVFVCRQNSASVEVRAVSKRAQASNDFDVVPKISLIRVFSDQVVQFECMSKANRPISIVFDEISRNLTLKRSSKNSRAIVEVSLKSKVEATLRGNVACLAQGMNDPVAQWSLQIVPVPELFLDNFEGEVDCLSNGIPTKMNTARCKNAMDCDFMAECFQNDTLCNHKKQKQFFATKNTTCWIEARGRSENCIAVPYSHLNGIAQCTIGGLTKQWQYFVSLDFLKYSNWMDAPKHELVRMDEQPSILYTNGSTQFVCTAVSFLFADSLSFDIEFRNGSRKSLTNGDSDLLVTIENPERENPRRIDEFNYLGVLNVSLPLETVAIHCLAPFGNSSDVWEASRRFETRHLIMPQFTQTARTGVQTETFYTGEKNRRLTCSVKGEPQPAYTWLYNKLSIKEKFPELKTSIGSHGEGYLDFPEISGSKDGKKYTGDFQCVAENKVGSVSRTFHLKIEDEPISGRTVIYIIVVVLILLLLLFVLLMLYVFFRKYKEAQELVRSLTDLEIQEFFDGKPELLSGNGNNFEMIEFLPYKSEYEIPLEDLQLDTSENNFLGSGEFAYVVRGMIISKDKSVAVKISKPTADVTVFKSLLSEVKIMIYIGSHPNVVQLIGVSTAGIRTRSIHIATEICELGSLDVFLRKARPTFESILNSNQEIDCKLLSPAAKDMDGPISTLDLISMCAQIANGMAYLSNKSVIHADLAARNVLLTSGKIAKISDFGLSKKLYECNNYVKKTKSPLPWRWMAIESLNTLTFSTRSDIWAYGVTLFEIFTLGDIPFPNEEWNKEFIMRVSSGMRMGRPKYCTQEIYSKIMMCWENEPELRPDFAVLSEFFNQLLKKYGYSLGGNDQSKGNAKKPSGPGNDFDPAAVLSKLSSSKPNGNGIGITKPKRQYMNVPNGKDTANDSIEMNERGPEPIYANFDK